MSKLNEICLSSSDEEAQPSSKRLKTSEQPETPAQSQQRDGAGASEVSDLNESTNEVEITNKPNNSSVVCENSENSENREKLEKPAVKNDEAPGEGGREHAEEGPVEKSESKTATAPQINEQSSPRQRLQKLVQEDEKPYDGKEANLEESAEIISAEMETACLEINTMGEESGVSIVCATSHTPFHGTLSQNGESGLLKMCGECGDRKTCFFGLRMKTPVTYGVPSEEKREVVESLADGPICSATCLKREALGLLLDHIRLLMIKAKDSRAELKIAIRSKIAYLQAKACALGEDIQTASAAINGRKAQQCTAYKSSGQFDNSLAESKAIVMDLKEAFKTLHRYTGGVREEKRKSMIRTEEQEEKVKVLAEFYSTEISKFVAADEILTSRDKFYIAYGALKDPYKEIILDIKKRRKNAALEEYQSSAPNRDPEIKFTSENEKDAKLEFRKGVLKVEYVLTAFKGEIASMVVEVLQRVRKIEPNPDKFEKDHERWKCNRAQEVEPLAIVTLPNAEATTRARSLLGFLDPFIDRLSEIAKNRCEVLVEKCRVIAKTDENYTALARLTVLNAAKLNKDRINLEERSQARIDEMVARAERIEQETDETIKKRLQKDARQVELEEKQLKRKEREESLIVAEKAIKEKESLLEVEKKQLKSREDAISAREKQFEAFEDAKKRSVTLGEIYEERKKER